MKRAARRSWVGEVYDEAVEMLIKWKRRRDAGKGGGDG
jgi:hypothetical protein